MDCKPCKWLSTILLVLIIVFAYAPNLVSGIDGKWVVIVAAILVLVSELMNNSTCEVAPVKKKK
jgi:hypothetical protein